MTESEPTETFRVECPDGGIMEFEARLSDILWAPAPEGGTTFTLPITVRSTVREGSIYDPEGAD